MKHSTLLLGVGTAIIITTLGTVAGNCAISDDRISSSSKSEVTQNEKKYRFNGTIVYHRNGDYYTIVSDSGEEYYPIDLPLGYNHGGMRVIVHGQSRGWAMGGQMRALSIYDISGYDPRGPVYIIERR